MGVNKIDKGQFVIYHSDNLSGSIELIFTSDMNSNYNDIVKDNQCYIALKDFNTNNIKLVFDEVISTLKRNGYNNFNKTIKVVVQNKEEEELINNITLGDDFEIVIVKEYEEQKEMDNVSNKKEATDEKKEEEFIERFLSYNTIIKVDNGIRHSYVQRIGDSANNSYMLENVSAKEIYDKYKELLNDEVNKGKFANMDSNAVVNEVLDAISIDGSKKRYYMESSLKQGASDQRGSASSSIAYQNGGVVNTEIGVVQNGPDNSQQYTVVEEENGHLNVVSPEVQQTTISTGGNTDFSSGSSYDVADDYDKGSNDYSMDNGDTIEEEEIQSRDVVNSNVKVRKRVLEKPNSTGIVSILEIGFILLLLGLVIMFFVFNK